MFETLFTLCNNKLAFSLFLTSIIMYIFALLLYLSLLLCYSGCLETLHVEFWFVWKFNCLIYLMLPCLLILLLLETLFLHFLSCWVAQLFCFASSMCFSNVLMLLKFWLYNLKDMRYHKLRSVGIHSITSSYFFFKCLFGGRICIIPTYLSSAGLLAFC